MKGQLILLSSTGSTGATSVRMIIYQDAQTNGAAAAVLDILETANWRSFRNLAQQERFTILSDKVHTMNYTAATITSANVIATQESSRFIKFNKVCNIPIEFDNTQSDGRLTTQRTNNIGVLFIGENVSITVDYTFRIRYSDGG